MVSRAARVWLPTAALAALVATAIRVASRPLDNPDTWFHLRLGREFLAGWDVRAPGSLTPAGTREWLPSQWFAEVVMARMEQHLGLGGLVFLSGLQVLLLVLVVLWTCGQRADLPMVLVVAVLTFLACSPGLTMRPQVLSFALTGVVAHTWWRAARSGARPWLLVPLTWFWATWHGMWPLALVLGVAGVTAGALHRRDRGRTVRGQLSVVGVCAVAGAVTPVGPGLYGAVVHVTGQAEFFREWGPTDFASGSGVALALLGLPPLLIWLRRGSAWPEVLFVGVGLSLALYSNRTAPLGAVVLAPLTAQSLQSLVGVPPARRWAVPLVVAGAVSACALAWTAARVDPVPSLLRSRPAMSVADLPAGTVVLTDRSTGSYLLGATPDVDPVMHGYGDTFTTAELQRNSDILDLERGWQDLVRSTGAEVAFLPTDQPLTAALEDAGWRVVEGDDDVELLTAPDDWDD